MGKTIGQIVLLAPPAWALYPFLGLFLVGCVVNGAWQAGIENAVISNARVEAGVTAIIEFVPSDKQIHALGDIRI